MSGLILLVEEASSPTGRQVPNSVSGKWGEIVVKARGRSERVVVKGPVFYDFSKWDPLNQSKKHGTHTFSSRYSTYITFSTYIMRGGPTGCRDLGQDDVTVFRYPLLCLQNVVSKGYSVFEELLWHLEQRGARFGELPIVFVDREQGQSKITLWEGIRSLARLTALRFRKPAICRT